MRPTRVTHHLARPLLAVLVAIPLFSCQQDEGEEILVLCGGSMRAALEQIIEQYAEVSDDTVLASYGGSGELCAQIQNTGRGDLYVCHDPFMPWAAEQELIAEWATVGYLDVVIVVPKGNPHGIRELGDLAAPGLRVGIGDRRYSTSGVMATQMLGGHPAGARILDNVRLETKGHQQRCNDVAMGSLDAALVWAPVAGLFAEQLEVIPLPVDLVDTITSATYEESDLRNVQVTAGIIAGARDREAVRRFYDYVTTAGREVFQEHGFRTTENAR